MINCIECKYYSSNPYLRCAVNPLEAISGGCDLGEVGKALSTADEDFPVWPPELYVDWHNGERISVNELTGIDRDLVLMGIPVGGLESAKDSINTLAKTGIGYQGALEIFGNISPLGVSIEATERALRSLGRLP